MTLRLLGIMNGSGRIWEHDGANRAALVVVGHWLFLHSLHPLHYCGLKFVLTVLKY